MQLAFLLPVAAGPAFLALHLLPADRGHQEHDGGSFRRSLLIRGLGVAGFAASADPATAGMSADACAACCDTDWCACDHRVCNCQAHFRKRGLAVPKDAAEAFEAAQASRIAAGSAAGEEELGDAWRAELNWRTAELPRWRPALEEDLEVRNSTLPGAGRGLFAARALPKGTVLPPYGGQQLTYREVGLREFSEGMTYTWCPLRNGAAMLEMSPQELIEGPKAQQLAYCVDSRIASEGNPARFVNGASSSDQCALVNVKMCELGQVGYFRTTRPVPAGTELITSYGADYWGFEGCRVRDRKSVV